MSTRSKHTDKGGATAVGGTFSVPIKRFHSDGETTTIRVEAATTGTAFDVTLTDKDGDIIYNRSDNEDILLDRTRVDVVGDMILTVLNASLPTDSFTYKVIMDELV